MKLLRIIFKKPQGLSTSKLIQELVFCQGRISIELKMAEYRGEDRSIYLPREVFLALEKFLNDCLNSVTTKDKDIVLLAFSVNNQKLEKLIFTSKGLTQSQLPQGLFHPDTAISRVCKTSSKQITVIDCMEFDQRRSVNKRSSVPTGGIEVNTGSLICYRVQDYKTDVGKFAVSIYSDKPKVFRSCDLSQKLVPIMKVFESVVLQYASELENAKDINEG